MSYALASTRLLILGMGALIWLITGIILCTVRPKHRNNVFVLTQMLRLVQPIVGVKVVIDCDLKALRKEMPAIFVGLHQCDWDIITMSDLPQPGVVCVGKKSLIYTPIFGLIFFLSGNILIDRDNRTKAAEAFLKLADKIKNKGLSVWVFPEGSRSGYGPVKPFKTGALHTAMRSKVKVYPFVTSTYTKQIKLGRLNNGEVHIKLLEPIDGATLNRQDIAKATAALRENMITAMHELDQHVLRPKDYVLPADR